MDAPRKKHPTTGKEVPDEAATVNVMRYIKPRQAEWPQADYIVGNPPFIGNKPMRETLGDGYAETLRKVYGAVPDSVDYVMYWWHRAATSLREGSIQRFGFITRNSITQKFNRRVVQGHLAAKNPAGIQFAVPNHPWVDSADGAQVRIAMTVAAADGAAKGMLQTVLTEESQEDGEVKVTLAESHGLIQADLSIGHNVLQMAPLRANQGLACPGVQLSGQGFVIEPGDLSRFSEKSRAHIIKRYMTGYDLMQRTREQYLIDTFDLDHDVLRDNYPDVFQHLADHVRDPRTAKITQTKNSRNYAAKWWRLSEARTTFRKTLTGLDRFIVSSRTSRHRVFQFCGPDFVPETKVLIIALRESWQLGVLSSQIHVVYATRRGGWHGVRQRSYLQSYRML